MSKLRSDGRPPREGQELGPISYQGESQEVGGLGGRRAKVSRSVGTGGSGTSGRQQESSLTF